MAYSSLPIWRQTDINPLTADGSEKLAFLYLCFLSTIKTLIWRWFEQSYVIFNYCYTSDYKVWLSFCSKSTFSFIGLSLNVKELILMQVYLVPRC